MQVTTPDTSKPDSKSMEIYIVIAFALVIIVAGTYFYNSSKKVSPPPIEVIEQTTTTETQPSAEQPDPDPAPEPAEIIKQTAPEPVIIEIPAEPLPTLDQSDALALESAQQLSWLPSYASMLNSKDIIRNFVTFIDNLARNELAVKFSPLLRPADQFMVLEIDDELYLDPESYQRYDIYIDVINSVNVEFALELYSKLKPLFEEAYQELGYPEGAFDSTLNQAITNALDAPLIRDKIKLVAPSAMYKFANPELEQLPSAQKLMIRMGPENMIKLRPKLQQIQSALLTE